MTAQDKQETRPENELIIWFDGSGTRHVFYGAFRVEANGKTVYDSDSGVSEVVRLTSELEEARDRVRQLKLGRD